MPSSTRCKPFRRAIRSKVSSDKASRLMLSRCKPAAFKSAACSASKMPLVVSAMSRIPGNLDQHFHQRRYIVPHQWFAAGQANFVDAQPRGDPHKASHLLERQQFLARPELDVLGRHAIKTADVAAIGDADPQVIVRSAKRIDEHRIHRFAPRIYRLAPPPTAGWFVTRINLSNRWVLRPLWAAGLNGRGGVRRWGGPNPWRRRSSFRISKLALRF